MAKKKKPILNIDIVALMVRASQAKGDLDKEAEVIKDYTTLKKQLAEEFAEQPHPRDRQILATLDSMVNKFMAS